jgi:hypothetical protein
MLLSYIDWYMTFCYFYVVIYLCGLMKYVFEYDLD